MVGRVGDGDEQLVATTPEGQGPVLPNKLLANQFLGLRISIDGAQIQECDAELLRRHLGQVPTLQQLVLHKVSNQWNLVALCLGVGLKCAAFIQQIGENQLFGKAGKRG